MRDLLSAEMVQKKVPDFYRVEFVEQIGSTNTAVRERAEAGEAAGYVLIADRQTQGRGRMGRSFYSPPGTGVYLSVLLRPRGPAADGTFITVAAAVAAFRAIKAAVGPETEIKWVNDLYLEGKKICGILTESSVNPQTGELDYAVCGVGFNLAQPEGGFPPELEDIAGAIYSFPVDRYARPRLAVSFLLEFFRALQEDRSCVMEEYRRRSMLIGKNVVSPSGAFEGPAEVLGINDNAGLILRLSDGTERVLSSGEVSIRLYE